MLEKFCTQKYETYKSSYTEQSYIDLAEVTKTQSLSNTWKLHRAGRITASNFHEVMHFTYRDNASSLLNKLMRYSAQPNTASLNYGREMEDKARQFYATIMQSSHDNFTVETTGLHVHVEKPFLGASPDGLTACSCHGQGLVEIKCPYKYRNGLKNFGKDKDFPVEENGKIKKKHKYYAQIQGQMKVLKTDFCDFFVWTPIEKDRNYI